MTDDIGLIPSISFLESYHVSCIQTIAKGIFEKRTPRNKLVCSAFNVHTCTYQVYENKPDYKFRPGRQILHFSEWRNNPVC